MLNLRNIWFYITIYTVLVLIYKGKLLSGITAYR